MSDQRKLPESAEPTLPFWIASGLLWLSVITTTFSGLDQVKGVFADPQYSIWCSLAGAAGGFIFLATCYFYKIERDSTIAIEPKVKIRCSYFGWKAKGISGIIIVTSSTFFLVSALCQDPFGYANVVQAKWNDTPNAFDDINDKQYRQGHIGDVLQPFGHCVAYCEISKRQRLRWLVVERFEIEVESYSDVPPLTRVLQGETFAECPFVFGATISPPKSGKQIFTAKLLSESPTVQEVKFDASEATPRIVRIEDDIPHSYLVRINADTPGIYRLRVFAVVRYERTEQSIPLFSDTAAKEFLFTYAPKPGT